MAPLSFSSFGYAGAAGIFTDKTARTVAGVPEAGIIAAASATGLLIILAGGGVSKKSLNERQQRFADYYIELGNATEAYRRAGYSPKGADAHAARLVVDGRIRAYIDQRLAEAEAARVANGDEVLRFLTSVMRGEVKEDALFLGDIVQKTVGARDRLKAAEQLGKVHRLYEGDNKDNGDGGWKTAIIDASKRREGKSRD